MDYGTNNGDLMQLGGEMTPQSAATVTAVTADDEKQAAKDAKAQQRAEAKAAKKAAKKAERERIRAETYQRVATVLETGKKLASDHDMYQTKYVTNANADLYALLTNIHAFAEQVLTNSDCNDILKEMRTQLRWEHEIKTQANSPELNIIVRYITRTNRKNACVYARVIRKAMADGITSSGLTAYIQKANGINNIREAVVKKPVEVTSIKKKKMFWDYAENYLDAQVLKPMTTFNLGHEHSAHICDTARGGRFHYFVCDFVGGEYKVLDVLLMDQDLEQQLLERVFCNIMAKEILKQEDVDLRNAIEAKLGITRKKPLVANAYVGN